MCYGTCNFETGRSGECDGWLLHCSDKIKEATGHKICFIGGGSIHCQEEEDYYDELLSNGTIDKYKKIIEEILESERNKLYEIKTDK